MKKTWRVARNVAMQALAIMVLLEVVGYTFDPFGISYFPEMAAYLDTMILEEPIGYRNRPHLNDAFFGVKVKINSLGMRDREVPSRDEHEFRILIMGDSLPFGVGVNYEDSLPFQLETLLNKNRSGSSSVRTLNMGTVSYNTEQELIQLRQAGITLNPQLALLLFSSNDIEPKMWIFEKRSSWLADYTQRSYGVSLLFTLFKEIKSTLMNPEQDSAAFRRFFDSRWTLIDDSLTEMNTLLRHNGIPFILFTWEKSGLIYEHLKGVADREGFPLAILNPWEDSRWNKEYPIKYQNSYIDSHPNAAGNAILARLIAEVLEGKGLLHSGN
jgi:lysophospholipase L1-like esterase